MEPPGQDVPASREAVAPATLGPLRLSAALATATLALAGHGHILVLGLLTAVAVGTRAGGVGALLASAATIARWASPSLTAVAGGQAVLGPAILVGSVATAASSWLAAAAIITATPRRARAGGDAVDQLLVPAVLGVVAGALAVGPTLVDEPALRVAGVVVAAALALVLARVRYPRVLAAVLGAAALGLAAIG